MPATRRHGILGFAGAVVIGLAGVGFLYTIVLTIFYQEHVLLAATVGPVLLIWPLTRRMKSWRVRILLRAFVASFCLTPFVPHASVEWVMPWPPAGFWIWNALRRGQVAEFELILVTVVGMVVTLAGLAVHRAQRATRNVL